jgi:hypothetical protein
MTATSIILRISLDRTTLRFRSYWLCSAAESEKVDRKLSLAIVSTKSTTLNDRFHFDQSYHRDGRFSLVAESPSFEQTKFPGQPPAYSIRKLYHTDNTRPQLPNHHHA